MSNTSVSFLDLNYYQQWVLFALHFSYKFKNSRGTQTESREYLHMEACMSAMVPGFSEAVADTALTDLIRRKLISLEPAQKEYKIEIAGIILSNQIIFRMYQLLENPDFEQLMKNAKRKAVVANLSVIRASSNYADTESTLKKLLRLGITCINGFSWAASLIK